MYNEQPIFKKSGAVGDSLGSSGSLFPLNPENVDLARKSRNERYFLLRSLARQVWNGKLPWHQARHCSRIAIPAEVKKKNGSYVPTGMPGTIQIQHKEDTDKHVYHGLGRCASALVCPVCSAIIQRKRAEEVVMAGRYLLSHGFQIAMITQTASHNSKTSLVDFIARFQAAQHDLKKMRQYKKWMVETGGRFTIRSIEVTDDKPDYAGRKTGWHYHTHSLFFFEREKAFTEDEARKYSKFFQQLWIKALNGVGLSGCIERAAVVSLPKANDLLDDVRESGNSASLDALCLYISKAFSWEVSGSRNKEGKDEDRRVSIWEIQKAALTDKPELLYRYAEYMRAVKGINWLRWSPGLKSFCGIDEKTDEEIMRGEEGDEIIYEFTNKSFKIVWQQAAQSKILDIADKGGQEALKQAVRALVSGCDPDTGELLQT